MTDSKESWKPSFDKAWMSNQIHLRIVNRDPAEFEWACLACNEFLDMRKPLCVSKHIKSRKHKRNMILVRLGE